MEKKSAVHKSACIVLCSQCSFLEFPGCGTHKQLLSVRKKNGHGKCAKCPCSTDTNGPWFNGCRMCKSPTRKLFWSISIREAQFLLRAFPTDKRSKDESAKMTILSCPCCGVVGFGGIDGGDGTEPVLALKTDEHDFDLGEGWSLDCEVVEERIQHLDGCPKASGGAKRGLEKLVASISFDEAKYIYSTIKNGETQASFVSRSGFLRNGMQIAIAEEEGPVHVNARDLLVGTYDKAEGDYEKEDNSQEGGSGEGR